MRVNAMRGGLQNAFILHIYIYRYTYSEDLQRMIVSKTLLLSRRVALGKYRARPAEEDFGRRSIGTTCGALSRSGDLGVHGCIFQDRHA